MFEVVVRLYYSTHTTRGSSSRPGISHGVCPFSLHDLLRK